MNRDFRYWYYCSPILTFNFFLSNIDLVQFPITVSNDVNQCKYMLLRNKHIPQKLVCIAMPCAMMQ